MNVRLQNKWRLQQDLGYWCVVAAILLKNLLHAIA